MDLDIDHLRSWIGREDSASEILSPTLVRQFNATFDRTSGEAPGDVAPLLIHFCLAQPAVQTAGLGPDGHAARGGFLPPVPLPRRMWAGGEFTFQGDIRIGEEVRRVSTVRDVVLKQGRTGPLCFVTVNHDVTSDGQPVLSERQDIVYREAQNVAGMKTTPAPATAGDDVMQITPSAAYLFRYSAMTFNGHRIHYDKDYVRDVEGYPGLIVHGPLQATLLCQFAADLKERAPKTFRFRSLSTIFDTADFSVNAQTEGETMKLWTAQLGGPVAMEATAAW
ncbi:metal-binding domain containing of MaoC dehydratase [Labrenzia sp. CP4]|jgi:3-methylfumaryl-CoA hydratase|uniref:FAS1-like dehydratase domain-containing protein n=1 Tax=Labrenzia sp. CP4 TaxID=1674922 RepID=UPI000781E8B8|nr:MaoC family dehydratase N-terminal domain-containing protein [Labrenzia sp. CP4]AMN52787.1 metal-binding domain containing of MaoC dehydratase [Labrenzia sp. CP4]